MPDFTVVDHIPANQNVEITPYPKAGDPNPIVTFVEEKDFKPTQAAQVKKDAGVDLLGLSQDEGKRQSIESERSGLELEMR